MRVLRWILGTIVVVLLLAVLGVVGGLFWANTAGGRAVIERLARENVPGLTIEGLQGPLPGRLSVARLGMADAQGNWLELEQAEIAIDFAALLHREVHITRIAATRIAVARAPVNEAPPEPPAESGGGGIPELPVSIRLDELRIGSLELGESLAGVGLRAAITGAADVSNRRIVARLDIQRQDAPGQLALRAELDPQAQRLALTLDAQEPPGGVVATLLGRQGEAFSAQVKLDGPATGATLALRAAIGADIAFDAHGTVSAGTDGAAALALQGEARAAPLLPPDAAPLATPVQFAIDAARAADGAMTLRSATVTTPAAEVRAQGGLDAAGRVSASGSLAVRDSARFGALVPDGFGWDAIQAQFSAEGPVAGPSVRLELTPAALRTAPAQLTAALGATPKLTLATEGLDRIRSLVLEGAAIRISAAGRVQDPLDLGVQVAAPDVARILPGSEGGLEAGLQVTGTMADPALALTARAARLAFGAQAVEGLELSAQVATPLTAPRVQARLGARYGGLPVTLDVDGNPEGSSLRLAKAEAGFGPARLSASGVFDPGATIFEGEARLDVPDAAPFSRLAGQPLSGSARLAARLTRADALQGFDATLEIPGFRFGATPVAGRLTARGTPDDAQIGLDVRSAENGATAQARITNGPDGRRITLPELRARGGGETIALAAPARILLAPDGAVVVESLALAPGRGGRLEVSGRHGPAQTALEARLTGLSLAGLAPGVPIDGRVEALLRLTGAAATPDAKLTLDARGLRNTEAAFRGMPPLDIHAEAELPRLQSLRATAEARAGNALRLNLDARAPQGFGANAPIQATVTGQGDVAALASPFVAGSANQVRGRAAIDLRADGTVGAPRAGGTIRLSEGQFRNTEFGATLTNMAALIRADGNRVVLDNFSARTPGNGSLTIAGNIDAGAPGMPVQVTVTARNARPVQSDAYTVQMDADVTVEGRATEALNAAGRVVIGRAEIRIPERMPASVRTIPDVRERGRGAPPPRPAPPPAQAGQQGGLQVALAIDVAAPRQIFIRGQGVDAEFGGNLRVRGTAAAPQVEGALTVRRGELSFFDRRFTFTRGNITFDSGTLVPSLDFLAAVRAREVQAQIALTGRPESPRIAFTSSPELPQDEVLSRILFDRTARELSPFQLAQLAQVVAGAAGVNTPSAGGFFERIRRTLALDRLGVGEEERSQQQPANSGSSAPTLEAGRYVADGVYVGVNQGTSGGSPRIGVQIDLLPRLRLEGATGGNTQAGDRIGLGYELEY
ncbi:MAG TPA: translocation/assembly module TamB domain-containing protein [Roseomonas sp.]|jgi:translocation and assembly module TamB